MTSLYGVIGNPISHSRSPQMHNRWFAEAGIDGQYFPFDIEPSRLEEAVRGMKALNLGGWNVTIPFKEAILPLLDQVDDDAINIGAVNTVQNRNGKLIGSNTDGAGFAASLLEKRTAEDIKQSSILIIGAGGAAKGIYYALTKLNPASITVSNRTEERAVSLIQSIKTPVKAQAVSIQECEKLLSSYDIVINTSSVGMFPHTERLPIEISGMKDNALAADIIYNPLETAFLKEARKHKADTLNGVGMFVQQGALAFSQWTGIKPDTEKAISRITEELGGTSC
ncbi:shikimate dehydrogenase [Jeotgalibacillus sp. ET6]|uniref:shikimate dehydrogenase n=1 Tax=Jeotgalibacillus sp. ET6 TaxID=3037260 RepID=UPI0024189A0E|nr:shikimate dehydrogenase [Jeotgalibacillus sp. ET6]MDG5470882.1 shikimate dehydrogenase [Jeotgalibacillus sp. ET6]